MGDLEYEEWKKRLNKSMENWPVYLDTQNNREIQLNPYFIGTDELTKHLIDCGVYIKL